MLDRKGHSKLNPLQTDALLRGFVDGITATTAARRAGTNRHTAHLFYQKCRSVAWRCMKPGNYRERTGRFERAPLDWHSPGKIAFIALFEDKGRVYAESLCDAIDGRLSPAVLRYRFRKPDALLYADALSRAKYLNIPALEYVAPALSKSSPPHLDPRKAFVDLLARMCRDYQSIPLNKTAFLLKEAEFRFNYGSPQEQYKTLKRWLARHSDARGQRPSRRIKPKA